MSVLSTVLERARGESLCILTTLITVTETSGSETLREPPRPRASRAVVRATAKSAETARARSNAGGERLRSLATHSPRSGGKPGLTSKGSLPLHGAGRPVVWEEERHASGEVEAARAWQLAITAAATPWPPSESSASSRSSSRCCTSCPRLRRRTARSPSRRATASPPAVLGADRETARQQSEADVARVAVRTLDSTRPVRAGAKFREGLNLERDSFNLDTA